VTCVLTKGGLEPSGTKSEDCREKSRDIGGIPAFKGKGFGGGEGSTLERSTNSLFRRKKTTKNSVWRKKGRSTGPGERAVVECGTRKVRGKKKTKTRETRKGKGYSRGFEVGKKKVGAPYSVLEATPPPQSGEV